MDGLTLHYGGKFNVGVNEVYQLSDTVNSGMYKIKLDPGDERIAWIPVNKFGELGVKEIPDWLQNYKGDTNSVKHLARWGYLYNHWGESEKALSYLERAKILNPDYEGLTFELSFAYNDLGEFDNALGILLPAIKNNPENCLLYKELAYTYYNIGKMNEAESTSVIGMAKCEDDQLKAQIAYNIAYLFYKEKNIPKFKRWAATVKAWSQANSVFTKNVINMEKELGL
jgi:tetratricopeptide (TPR) repeat protein